MAYTTINKSSENFTPQTYSGNSFDGRELLNFGFAPDMAWVKRRDDPRSHFVADTIRGGNKQLKVNLTGTETTYTGYIQSFLSDGFSLGNDGDSNATGGTYVSWAWKGGGTGVANTAGSINSTVSANTTNGFSVVSFTGTEANATVGHGLSSAPKFIFGKNRNVSTSAWPVYHASIGATKYLNINTNSAEGTFGGYWNDTAPTSSLISIGSHADVNGSGNSMIYYCFADVQGYSKISSYTGNGSTNGSFIYTGFKPSFVMIKNTTDSATDWCLRDNKRSPYNVTQHTLFPNTNDTESYGGTSYDIDFLSNGFKIRNTSARFNTSGSNYAYMSFAEAPLVGSNNVPANAR